MREHHWFMRLIAVCCTIALLLSFPFTPVSAAEAETGNRITATTGAAIKQGNTGYCYVYIDSLESLFSLDVTVYFDPATVRVTSSYNQVTTAMYDSSVKEDHVQYTYLFDGEGNNEQTQLFYFEYQVLSDAPLGESFFDVVVGEAYDKDLQLVPLSGSRCSFQVQQTLTNLSCSISGTSSVSTTVEQEFTLSYRFSKTAIASGSFVIRYDPELFALESLTQGDFLTDKMTDVNTALSGAIYVSFLGSTYGNGKQLLTLKFKTLKNVTQTAPITLTVTDLYDLNLNPISCDGYTTNVQLNKDLTYDEDAAAMWLETAYDQQSGQLQLTVQLEAGAKLGAGDFVLTFNTQRYTYLSAQKEFSPTFFNINDKEAEKGILKFSIISFTDIVEATKVLTVQFSADAPCEDTPAAFDISGSGTTDSLTNAVVVNFRGCTAAEPGHTPVTDAAALPTCLETGLTEGSHCRVCQKILVAQETIPAIGHDEIPHDSLAPTCTEIGWEAYVTCSRCDYTTYAELPANGHSYSHSFCTVCGEKQPAGNSWDVSAAGDGSLTASLYPNPDGTYDLELTGSGDMCTWSSRRQVPWYGYAADITQVRIPADVTSLGAYAFWGFTHLEQLRFDAVAMTDLPYNHCTFLGAGKEGAGVQVIIGSGVTRIPAHLLDSYESANGAKLSEIIFEADSRCESIGNGAFQYATGFTGVTLPACLTSIEGNAFYSCTDLKEINIPKQVSVIGESAFACCSKLERVELPEGLTELSGYVFYDCTALREITLPEGVTAIGSYTFYDCAALQALTLPAGITAIGDYAFYGCAALQAVNLPQCLQTLGEYAFYNCTAVTQLRLDAVALSDLKNLNLVFAYCGQSADGITVTVGSGVTVLPAYLFYPTSYNNALAPKITQMRFEAESACVRISDRVFVGNSWLQTIALPAGLQSIGDNAFYGCTALQQIDLPEGLQSIGASTFNGCIALQEISLPAGMTSIGYRAFYGCTALQTADLPASLTTLSSEAFYGCTALRSVNLPESLTTLGSHAFYNCTALTQLRLEAVELGDLFSDNYVLAYCGRAADGITLTVGSGVTRIPAYLFCPYIYGTDYIPNLTKVIFEEGSACRHIGTNAFYYCTALRELELPVSLRTMGSGAFENCTGLTKLQFNAVAMNDLASNNRVFTYCGQSGDGIAVTVGSGVTKLPAYLFYPRSNTSYAAKLKAVVFEENSACRSIGNYAFCGAGMTELALPESVRTIGSYAFQRCTALQKVNLPASLQTIGYYAFYGCTALTQLRLDAVAMIDLEYYDPVFGGCGQNTDGLTVTVGSGVTRIPQKLFYATHSAPNFKAVIFEEGSSCESIGEQAFYYCDSLKQILLPTSVTSIGPEAFWGCNGLTVGFSGETLPEQLGDYWVVDGRYYLHVQEMVMEGDSGYAILSDGTAVLTGYYGEDTAYTVAEKIGDVPVTTIGIGAFSRHTELTQVTIPESITVIDNFAFYGCDGLNHILIPSSVSKIGHYAFAECYQLTVGIQAAQLPEQLGEGWVDGDRYYLAVRDMHRVGDATYAVLENGTAALTQYHGADTAFTVAEKIGDAPVTALGAGAFRYNTVLTTVLCPETVTAIGAEAFYECTALREITLPKSLTSLGNGAFYGCTALEKIRIDAVALSDLPYENYVFSRCGHSGDGITVTVDNAVTRIPDRLFAPNDYDYGYHPHITAVVFEAESVCRSIGERAFAFNRGIKMIQLPDRITTIGSHAFYGCDGLQTVSLPAELTAIEEGAFYDCTALQRIILPENLMTLGNYAFYNCTGLTELQLHAAAMEDLGADNYALGYCGQSGEGISVTIGSGVTKIPAYLFDPNGGDASVAPKLTAVEFAEGSACQSIGSFAFYNCTALAELQLPESLMTIGSYAFYGCTGLETLTLPESLQTIGSNAFQGCTGLESLTLPESLQTIGNYAFYNCTSLTKINYNAISLADLSGENFAFSYCGQSGDGITVSVGSSVTKIPAYLFYPYSGSGYAPKIVAVEFAENSVCETIGSYAFYGCTDLKSLTLPEVLQTIGADAFSRCTGLESLTLPEGLQTIVGYAFYNCTGLESLTLPESLQTIGNYAFYNCRSLAKINFNAANLADLGSNNYVFSYAGQNGDGITVTVASSVTKIPAYLFYPYSSSSYAPKIVTVEFAEGSACQSIGDRAFYNCTGLTELTLPESLQTVGEYAFYGCTGLKNVMVLSSAVAEQLISVDAAGYLTQYAPTVLLPGDTTINSYLQNKYANREQIIRDGVSYWLLDQNTHSWLETQTLIERIPCQVDGLIRYTCEHCEIYKDVTVERHTIVEHEAKAPDCETVGWDAYQTCAECEYTTYAEIPALGHRVLVPDTSGEVLITVENDSTYPFVFDGTTYSSTNTADLSSATVTVKALYDCTLEFQYKVSSETNYDFLTLTHNGTELVRVSGVMDWKTRFLSLSAGDTVRITYLKDGSRSRNEDTGWFRLAASRLVEAPAEQAQPDCVNPVVCQFCKVMVKAAMGHDEAHHEARAVTCLEIGWDAYETCSRCDYTTYKEIPALGHDEIHHEARAVTCLEIGWDAYKTCSRCDYSTYQEIQALGHDKIAHEAKAANCTEIGWDAYETCSRCDYSTYAEIPALGHDTVSHEGKAVTCVTIGWDAYDTCSRCDYSTYVEIPADGKTHDPVPHGAAAPTCTEIGWEAYDTCSRCDYTSYKEIPALGHSFVETFCTVCGVKQTPLHTWDASAAGDGSLVAYLYQNFVDGGYELELEGSGPMANYDYSNYAPWHSYNSYINWIGLPDGLTTIGNMAFQSCYALRQLRIPASVVSVGNYAFSYSNQLVLLFEGEAVPAGGYGWADGCGYYLKPRKVILKEDATYVIDKDGNAILAKYIGSGKEFVALETVEGIPVTQIGRYAFYQRKLNTYWIPDAIEAIGENAFSQADGIALLFAENSLPVVGSYWNGGNDYYLGATVWNEEDFLFVRDKDDCVDVICYQGSEKEIAVPAQPGGYPLTRIRSYAFYRSPVEQIVLPEGIESICAYAFSESRLRQIHLPDSLTEIGNSGFNNCYNLEEILFPENLRYIGYQAFWYCTGLKEVTIPDTITNLNSATFTCCSSLEKITLPKKLSSVGHMEFYGCTKLREIELPETLHAVGSNCFWNTPKLKVVYIRSSRLAATLTSSDAAEDMILRAETVVVPAGTGTDYIKNTYPHCETRERKGMAVDVYSQCAHDWQTETVAEYVHCVQDGYQVHTCSLCNVQTDTRTSKHTLQQSQVAPTCTEKGYTLYSCPDCGESYKTAPVDQLGHQPNEETFLCERCGEAAYLLLLTDSTGTRGFDSWEEAMSAASAESTLQLQGNISGDVSVTKTLYLDLNGHSVDGTVTVSQGAVLYGTDSTATLTDASAGRIKTVSGVLSTVAEQADGRRYAALTDETGISFHRWQLQLHTVTLRTAKVGIYYKASLECDDALRAEITRHGVALSVAQMPGVDFKADGRYTWIDGAPTGEFTSGSVFNILRSGLTPEENAARGAMKIYANAYVQLADGTILMSDATTGDKATDSDFDGIAYSLFDVMQLLDEQYAQLAPEAQQNVAAFYAAWKENGMQDLKLENISAEA